MKKTCLFLFLFGILFLFSSWGFFAHQRINRLAVFTLPSDLIGLYKTNITHISEHAVDADKRRYADSLEGPRHFIDADHYGESPFDSIPQKYMDAVARFGRDTIQLYGTLPWHIEKTYYGLVRAFEEKNLSRILRFSADLGHYVSDAHVPLHTTENYNGQLTNQIGIHGFWESRLPELFAHNYDNFVGKATYIDNPLKAGWKIIRKTYAYKDSVLKIEARISRTFPSDQKFSYSDRNGKIIRQYSAEYANAYHTALKGMVEEQMRASILAVGSFWYSAWVDAGQPDIRTLRQKESAEEERETLQKIEKRYKEGKIIGRNETE